MDNVKQEPQGPANSFCAQVPQERKIFEGEAINLLEAETGNPAGGHAHSLGIEIKWQNGPLNRGIDRHPPNGAFVENVIGAAIQRLEFCQTSKFWCDENKVALQSLYAALGALKLRTKNRESRGIEGTHRF